MERLDTSPAEGPEEREAGPFRSLVDQNPTALFVFNADRVLYVNPAAEALTGYVVDELVGRPFWVLAAPEFRDRLEQGESARLAGRSAPDYYELQLRCKEGEPRWIHLSSRRVELDGSPVVLATAVDVSRYRRAEDELSEKESLLKLAQRAGRSVTWDWNTLTDELSFSDSAAEIFTFAATHPPRTRQDFCRFVHAADRGPLGEAVRQALRSGDPLSIEVRLEPEKGDLYWVLLRGRSHRVEPGWAVRMVGVATDITDRRRAEEALHREKERAQITLGSIGDGVIRTDADGKIDYMNPAAETIAGWTHAEAHGRSLAEVLSVVDQVSRQPIVDPVERCLKEQRVVARPGKDLLLRRDGSEVEIRHTTALIRDHEQRVTGAVLVLRDLTELRAVEREMLYLATHDGLTGLYNRTEFERRLGRALESARDEDRVHALCYLDLDEFKLINDSCGHLAGDEMLGQIGSLLKCRFRETDTLGRLGGDEFGVLLENCPPRRAMEIARELCKDIRSFRFSWDDNIFSTSSSVGLVAIGPESGDLTRVLSAADGACYLAKERGGNRVHEYQADDSDLMERFGQIQVIQRIHAALEEGAFVLHQQVVRPLAERAAGPLFYEILVRMLDEGGELVAPASFIPVAERHRLVSSIDRWVVKASLAGLVDRGTGSPETAFAINLSGQSLGDESFLEFVVRELAGSNLRPRRVLFEITETASISHLGRAMRFISVLRGKGCRFVLDDFGSGLSSFAYLRNLPVDFIKIDGQFVQRLTRDPIHRALVESINHIGHVMHLKTIAEAVENEETFDALSKMKVDYAQGFWIARPEPLPTPRRSRG